MLKEDILVDIKTNIVDIIVRRDKRYQIVTIDHTYIFSDRHHLITTYPNKKNIGTRIREMLK